MQLRMVASGGVKTASRVAASKITSSMDPQSEIGGIDAASRHRFARFDRC